MASLVAAVADPRCGRSTVLGSSRRAGGTSWLVLVDIQTGGAELGPPAAPRSARRVDDGAAARVDEDRSALASAPRRAHRSGAGSRRVRGTWRLTKSDAASRSWSSQPLGRPRRHRRARARRHEQSHVEAAQAAPRPGGRCVRSPRARRSRRPARARGASCSAASPLAAADHGVGLGHPPPGGQHQRDGELGSRIGEDARRVRGADPSRAGGLEVDVVVVRRRSSRPPSASCRRRRATLVHRDARVGDDRVGAGSVARQPGLPGPCRRPRR